MIASKRGHGTGMLAAAAVVLLLVLAGCKSAPEPDYNRPLPEGTFGLRLIADPARLPDLTPAADQLADPAFQEALARSIAWYAKPSSMQHFPAGGRISHAHAHASAYALRELGQMEASASLQRLREEFDVWESVGWDGSGEVFFTGYYTPIFRASRTRSSAFSHPLYTRPDDLVSDPVTGEVRGRQTDAGIVPYPTRAEIDSRNLLAGRELVYLSNRLDAYLIHVNGSARLEMAEGGVMYVGYAGTNGRAYTSIGGLLVEAGHIPEHRLSLSTLRAYFQENPGQLESYIRQNDRFVFFREYAGDDWPAGSLGVKVTTRRSLATDKSVFPRACVVLVQTDMAGPDGTLRPASQLMVDQDTGGAIRAAGRGDIYMGIGDRAGRAAGEQASRGRMYYLLLKRDHVQRWYDQMTQDSIGSARMN